MAEQQSFKHHAKLVAGFHGFVLPVLVLNVVQALVRLIHLGFTFDGLVRLLTAVALFALAAYARTFALTVQDRVIRLEERLRMERLFPEDLKPRIGEFTRDQLVALRFASDAELPALARKVLTDQIADRKTIKQQVQSWRADHLRA